MMTTNAEDNHTPDETDGIDFSPLDWDGDKVDLDEVVLDNGHQYASYVNYERAIPRLEDGLKPVHRRIIWSMAELGLTNDKSYRKSALAVGAIIGNYHPHGDASVYDAMVRLAQHFQSGTPLIEGQGNFGTLDDPPAAMRYTEAKLSKIASEWIPDTRQEIVPFRANFSETQREPEVIPVSFPVLLTVSQSGIGWALASSIPPHSLAEVIDATVFRAESPTSTLAQVMKRLPGPDFPGGGVIVNPGKLEGIYSTGQGTVKLRGRYHLENMAGGRQAVIITELPHQVSPDQIVRQVVDAARAGKIEDVTEMPRNLSSHEHAVRVQVICKRGGNVQRLVADLLRHTKLEDTVSFNMTTLFQGRPQVMGLIAILDGWIAFRHGVITKRLEHERNVLNRELHRLLGLLAALDVIDTVVKIIRGADDDADAKVKLVAKLRFTPHGAKRSQPIDDQQAQWIIDMPLKRLSKLNSGNLRADADQKAARVDEITAVLESEHGVRDIMIAELRDTKKRFAVPRATVLMDADAAAAASTPGAPTAVSSGPATDVTVFVASTGSAAAVARTGKPPKSAALTLGANGRLASVVDTRSDVPLVVISEHGSAFRTPVPALESRKTKGQPLVGLDRSDAVAVVLPDDGDASHALLVTEHGVVKRIEWSLLSSSHAGGTPCFKVPDGDRVVAAVPHTDDDLVVLHTAHGRALRIEMGKLRAVQSGSAGGVAGMALKGDDRIVSACVDHGDDVVVIHELGFAKRVGLDEYPPKGRGGGGIASADPAKPAKEPAGPIGVACVAPEGAPLTAFTERGQMFTFTSDQLPRVARAVISRRVLEAGVGDRIVGVTFE